MERMVFLLVKGRETNERQYTTQASLAEATHQAAGRWLFAPTVSRFGGYAIWLLDATASHTHFLMTNLAPSVPRTKNIFGGFMSDQARVEAHLYACLLSPMSTFNRCFTGYVTEC
jgi:hypothetical protein